MHNKNKYYFCRFVPNEKKREKANK